MKKFLKGAVVLLIAIAMVFSTTVVIADNEKTHKMYAVEQNNPQPFIQNSFPANTRASIWNNGDPDFVNAWCCQRLGFVGYSEIADDFHLWNDYTIHKLVWETIDDADYIWDGFADMILYPYSSNGPKLPIFWALFEVACTRELLGEQWNRSWYRYEIDFQSQDLEFSLPYGDYYIVLRPYSAGTTGQSYWMTSQPVPGSTSECYFQSKYFGYPTWVPGSIPFGAPYDVNFKIYGIDKSSREINKPLLNFLQSHPNLFPLLQKLLLQFGIYNN